MELHWRASGCRHIVNIIEVYENEYGKKNCLLVVMEWYVFSFLLLCYILQRTMDSFIFCLVVAWKAENYFKESKIVKMEHLRKEVCIYLSMYLD